MMELPDPTEKLVVLPGWSTRVSADLRFPGIRCGWRSSVLNWRSRLMRMQGKAYVDGKLVCEGIVTSQMVPRNTKPEHPDPVARRICC